MPPAAIRMWEPSSETPGICSGSPASSVGSLGMSSPAGVFEATATVPVDGVVVVDRAGSGELAAGREDVPLAGEDEVIEVGRGGDVAGAEVGVGWISAAEAVRGERAVEGVVAAGCDRGGRSAVRVET